MYKKIIVLTFLSISSLCFAQKSDSEAKWYSLAELDFVFPNNKVYFYNDLNNRILDTELAVDGFLLNSFGLQYSYNYLLFSKFSIGVVTGFQTHTEPNLFLIKLGGIIKYHFVDKNNIFVYLQDANNFSLDKDKFKSGNNFRLGMGFPVLKKEGFNLNTNLFFEQNYFKLDGTTPLLSDERPRSLTLKSLGVSVGIKF